MSYFIQLEVLKLTLKMVTIISFNEDNLFENKGLVSYFYNQRLSFFLNP